MTKAQHAYTDKNIKIYDAIVLCYGYVKLVKQVQCKRLSNLGKQ